MYGEPSRIRAVAERLERRAEDVRSLADELHTASLTVGWTSVAADRMRREAAGRRDELHAVARDYAEAAERVRAHAREVQRLLDLVAAAEREVRSAVAAAADRVQGALAAVAHGLQEGLTADDEADRQLAATPLPPPGHLSWLDLTDLTRGGRP
jgi:methyl-accepting chemotaxis protein